MKKEEQQLEEMRIQLEQPPIPEQRIDEAIIAGFHRAHTQQKKRRRNIWLSVVAALLLVGFVTSVRVSPAFANAVSSIPGLRTIVEMIKWDKGMKDIVENEYFEELNITVIEDDISVTLLGVTADESGMILSYKVEAPFDIQHLDTKNLNVYQSGKELEAAYYYNWYPNEPTKSFEDRVMITAEKPLNFNRPDFELRMVIDNDEQTTFHIPFTLKKKIKKSITYPINQTVDIDGQKLIVHELTISPLRAAITLSPHNENTMELLSIEEIKLTDENGEEWGSITNGLTGFGSNSGIRTVFIQSNYFRTPKELYLKIDRIQALPKGEHFIRVDFDKKEVVSQPKNLPITISNITNNSFKAEIPNISQTFHHGIFGEARDAKDLTLNLSSSSYVYSDDFLSFEEIYKTQNFANPVKIMINSYPNYLDGSVVVQIK